MRNAFIPMICFLFLLSTVGIVSSGENLEIVSEPDINFELGTRGDLYVGVNQTYNRIQDAIDNATNGDTVYVENGKYIENIIINKSLNLIGSGLSNTIIDGSGAGNVVLIVSNDVKFKGFTIINSSNKWLKAEGGIKLFKVNSVTVENNSCTENEIGIVLDNSDSNIIQNNNCSSNRENGIRLINGSDNNIVLNNRAFFNKAGIVLTANSNNNIVTLNNASFNSPYHGINLDNRCNGNIIANNTASSNFDEGIYLFNNCEDNEIYNNTVAFNKDHGIILQFNSNNNRIHHNIIISNKNQARDDGDNTWDNGRGEGNYWSNWLTPDTDRNGIVDIPYRFYIGNNASDLYPLTDVYDLPGPAVISSVPEAKSKNVNVGISKISIEFSRAMNRFSVEKSLNVFPVINYTSSWDESDTILNLNVQSKLRYNTSYSVSIGSSATDLEGRSLISGFILNFTTEKKGSDVIPPGGEPEPDNLIDYVDNAVFGIVFLVLFFIILTAVIMVVFKKRNITRTPGASWKDLDERKEYQIKGLGDEFDTGAQFRDDSYELIRDLKREVMSVEQVRGEPYSKRKIVEASIKQFHRGELSRETIDSILDTIDTDHL